MFRIKWKRIFNQAVKFASYVNPDLYLFKNQKPEVKELDKYNTRYSKEIFVSQQKKQARIRASNKKNLER